MDKCKGNEIVKLYKTKADGQPYKFTVKFTTYLHDYRIGLIKNLLKKKA